MKRNLKSCQNQKKDHLQKDRNQIDIRLLVSNPGYKKRIDFFDILRENNFGEFYT